MCSGAGAGAACELTRGMWCAQAFAWFSDLLAEHEELFWSLFQVDMDAVLDGMPPDNWDAFPLFQILNDYLRTHSALPS